ncbi:MAG: translation initiation factor IF-2 [Alphaproteobacteria bacterium]|jgi:translation initiation factor IF-2|nr:translation initiation factor IF-2 [Alphaproteobacteria bacterium]
MTDSKDTDRKTLSLGTRGRLTLGKPGEPGAQQVRQSFSHGRSKTVQVEVKRKRHVEHGGAGLADGGAAARMAAEGTPNKVSVKARGRGGATRTLTKAERDARERALKTARMEEEEARRAPPIGDVAVLEEERLPEEVEEPVVLDAETLRAREMEELRKIEEDAQRKVEEERQRLEQAERQRHEEEAKRRDAETEKKKAQQDEVTRRKVADRAGQAAAAKVGERPGAPGHAAAPAARPEGPVQARGPGRGPGEDTEDQTAKARKGKGDAKKAAAPSRAKSGQSRRRSGKMTVSQALSDEGTERTRSLASVRRQRERERLAQLAAQQAQDKVIREVVVPETLTVQELANRMAERSADVIKALMRMGVMATINQVIDADTAELLVSEFGHKIKRVSESDVLIGLKGERDENIALQPRPPVVTIMGHVDHGKTSLLDAMRQTDVAAKEAGGITQHIGAYQVVLQSGERITFIDTPGHAAFTAMRARGANTTDIVILVVAADDGVMPQTVEAIRHAKAAAVPIIVAINKVDLPDANIERIRNELLQYEVVAEELGGDVQMVEVSAKAKTGLADLQEAILLQSEVLELTANPERAAEGVVIEAKLERGRGPVATILVQRGTLRVGDVFVTGSEWGRVRALINDRGEQMKAAEPGRPVEVLGLDGAPQAGDDFVVVDSEQRARDVKAFRERKKREASQVATARGSLEEMFQQIKKGAAKELPIVIKGDVQGSIEAIAASLEKLTEANEEVAVRVLHAGVGGINESDITLAAATQAIVIGFNVRANPQARELAKRDSIEIRYYSIIYDVIDDIRQTLTGLLAPGVRETFLGNAQIREVFNITKVGKVAGCMVVEGVVKRGAKVRLLRDDVVVHEGTLKTLKRFKDEVREVREGFECGMAFENYEDIRAGDLVEAFEVEEVARAL